MRDRCVRVFAGWLGVCACACGTMSDPAVPQGKAGASNTSERDASAASGVTNASSSSGGAASSSAGLGQGGATTTLGAGSALGGAVQATSGGTRAASSAGVGGSQLLSSGGASATANVTSSTSGGAGPIATGGMAAAGTNSDISVGGNQSGGTTGTDAAPSNKAGNGNTEPVPVCFPELLKTPNVIALGDASPTGADVEGGLWVGGDADFRGYGVGSSRSTYPSCAAGNYSLVVGGDLDGSVSAGNGYVAVYGTVNSTVVVSACGVTSDRVVDFAAVSETLLELSADLKRLPANGSAAVESGTLKLRGESDVRNVFNLTAADLTGVMRIQFMVHEESTVIVNVSGESVLWGGMGFLLADGNQSCRGATPTTGCKRILYNFYEATTLDLSGIGVQGSILAPLATLSGAGGNVDGQVFVRNLQGQIEFHPYLFAGCLRL